MANTGPLDETQDTAAHAGVVSSMVMPTPIGQVLIEATPLGVSRLAFLSDAEAASLPPLSLGLNTNSTGSSILVAAASQVGAYFAGKRKSFDLPLDLKGTPFQRQVWRKMLKVPFGDVQSASWLVAEMGGEGSLADILQAISENPIPIIVPCHRIVGPDAQAAGYIGGVERKRFLLQHEGVPTESLTAP